MKKLLAKVRAKKQPQEPAGRITTDTLAEHREKVLAGGRKFKYPVQYQRHKLVINAAIISVTALLVLIGLGWYLLYPAQNTSEFMYRVTKVVPVPVASIEGEPVRYSSYLMKYRSAVHYLVEKEQIDTTTEDGKRQLDFVKAQSMDDAIADAYASKLARELDVQVTSAELEEYLLLQRQASDGEVTEATYNSVIEDYYGWSPDEYRDAMKNKLLRQKVAFAVDADAQKLTKDIDAKLVAGEQSLLVLSDTFNAQSEGSVLYTPEAWVPRTNRDGGLAEAAAGLQKGAVSKALKTTTGDGYYYVKLIDSNDTQVQYAVLQVPLNAFQSKLSALQADNQVSKYIKIEDLSTQE